MTKEDRRLVLWYCTAAYVAMLLDVTGWVLSHSFDPSPTAPVRVQVGWRLSQLMFALMPWLVLFGIVLLINIPPLRRRALVLTPLVLMPVLWFATGP